MKIFAVNTSSELIEKARHELLRFAREETKVVPHVFVIQSDNIAHEVANYAASYDLVILGLHRLSHRRKAFGEIVLQIARSTSCGIIMINRRG